MQKSDEDGTRGYYGHNRAVEWRRWCVSFGATHHTKQTHA
jgi:hypothetical protein